MRLRKGPVWLAGFLACAVVIAGGFISDREQVILAGLSSLVWIVGIGLGANVGEAVQRSAFYKAELDNRDKGDRCAQ